ncbi:unnamed protein product [Toxocara canis]|uniref:PH domain-containing protein n=1 Tax=Toxocara canis TaxID=6265 RepID=A0A183UR49_TOXCA|nr:unnamed protein product [Toxocara canis]
MRLMLTFIKEARMNWRTDATRKTPNSTRIDIRSADVKKLRSRWEVSSATGTPLHPDQNPDELMEAAVRMSRSVNQLKSWSAKTASVMDTHDKGDVVDQLYGKVAANITDIVTSTVFSLFVVSTDIVLIFQEPKQSEEIDKKMEAPNLNEAKDDNFEATGTPKVAVNITAGDSSATREQDQVIDDLFNFIYELIGMRLGGVLLENGLEKACVTVLVRLTNKSPNKNSSLLSAVLSTPEMRSPNTVPPSAVLTAETSEENLPLAHSISFYRSKKNLIRHTGETIVLGQFTTSPPQDPSLSSSSTPMLFEGERFQKEKARLEQAIIVQEKQVAQATRALHFCRNTEEFRGSREQVLLHVDAQRALLIATERRRALIFELDRIKQAKADGTGERLSSGPKGTITISHISIKLMRDFINGHINYHNDCFRVKNVLVLEEFADQLLFYFIVLIRYGGTVLHTTMTTSDEGLKSGKLEFPHYIQLNSLPHDFSCSLKVYALRTQREIIEHHEKYRIKGATVKKSVKSPMLNAAFCSSPGGPSAEVDPSFQLVGSLTLNIGSLRKNKFQLVDPMSPLDGAIEMSLRCYAEETGTIGHKAFVSLYQDVENMASWTRFWCVLSEGQLRFWRYPEDEAAKAPVVSIDLRTCACNEIKAIPVESCPYPNSMQVDVWVPGESQGKRDKIRVLMAADRKDEMHKWLKVMNGSLKNLTLWNPR